MHIPRFPSPSLIEIEAQVQKPTIMNITNAYRVISRLAGAGMAGAALMAASLVAAQEPPSMEEMWRIIQVQQKQIEELTARLNASETTSSETARQVTEVDAKVEATTSFVERLQSDALPASDGWFRRTQLGGYGEMHLNIGPADTIDFHRFVGFVSHDFSEGIRFFSEIELEHSLAGEGRPGEIELEQAYLEFDLSDATKAKAGLILLPIGLLNEIHEPNTFYGAERNRVEGEIIPTTWWEGGAALSHHYANGLSVDVALHSGLNVPTTGSNAFRIRSGRQKVANAIASEGAVTGRVKYTGIAGLELGLSLQYQQDLVQSALSERIDGTLVSTHFDWRHGDFGLRGLYARWDLGGNAPKLIGADEKYGFYLEPSYRFATPYGPFGLFARFSRLDVSAGDNLGSAQNYWDFGVNYWPHERVVLKADVQFPDLPAGSDDETVNLGVGYQF